MEPIPRPLLQKLALTLLVGAGCSYRFYSREQRAKVMLP